MTQQSNIKKKVIFFGSPDFAVPSLKALTEINELEVVAVFTPPDKPAGRGKKIQKSPVKIFAESKNIKVLQPKKIRKVWKECLEELKGFGEIDLGVVAAYGHILTKEILDFPTKGCINVHPSILPKWRGATPIHRPILNGEKETGLTLMKMDEGLDTGDIVVIEKMDISEFATFGEMHDKLARLGHEMLLKYTVPYIQGELRLRPQNDDESIYADKISKEDARIDWSQKAIEIERKVRAFNPFPGAFTLLQGKRFKILMAKTKDMNTKKAKNATVTLVDNNMLEVQCEDCVLSLEEVQLEGKSKMKIGEFLTGFDVKVGEVLG